MSEIDLASASAICLLKNYIYLVAVENIKHSLPYVIAHVDFRDRSVCGDVLRL